MELDRITRKIRIEVKGAEHSLLFTLSGLEQIDDFFPGGVMGMASHAEDLMKIKTLVKLLKIALNNAGERVDDEQARAIAGVIIKENGLVYLANALLATLGACGVLGKEAGNKVLQSVGLTPDEVDEPKK